MNNVFPFIIINIFDLLFHRQHTHKLEFIMRMPPLHSLVSLFVRCWSSSFVLCMRRCCSCRQTQRLVSLTAVASNTIDCFNASVHYITKQFKDVVHQSEIAVDNRFIITIISSVTNAIDVVDVLKKSNMQLSIQTSTMNRHSYNRSTNVFDALITTSRHWSYRYSNYKLDRCNRFTSRLLSRSDRRLVSDEKNRSMQLLFVLHVYDKNESFKKRISNCNIVERKRRHNSSKNLPDKCIHQRLLCSFDVH